MRKTVLPILISIAFLIGLSHCKKSGGDIRKDPTDNSSFVLPLGDFRLSIAEVEKKEKERGTSVTKVDDSHLKVSYNENEYKISYTYYFQEGKYKVAVGDLQNQYTLNKTLESLSKEESGFKLDKNASKSNNERVYRNSKHKQVLALTTEENDDSKYYSFTFGPDDESFFSWTRTGTLEKNHLISPLMGRFSPKELMYRFEARLGHSYNTNKSAPDRSLYIFNTDLTKIQEVWYYYDLETNTKLEEVALILNKDNMPNSDEIDSYLTDMGYTITPLSSPSAKSEAQIYYCSSEQAVASVEIKPKKDDKGNIVDDNFTRKIHFYFQDLTDNLPKENVDIPWPVLPLGKMSIEEATEKYTQQPYYDHHEIDPDFGEPMVRIYTNNPDFPFIILMPGDGNLSDKYTAGLIFSSGPRVIMSPSIPTIFKEKGYDYDPNYSILPTYINLTDYVMFQVDLKATFFGYTIGFQPYEEKTQ